jgi:hypothetical protein
MFTLYDRSKTKTQNVCAFFPKIMVDPCRGIDGRFYYLSYYSTASFSYEIGMNIYDEERM